MDKYPAISGLISRNRIIIQLFRDINPDLKFWHQPQNHLLSDPLKALTILSNFCSIFLNPRYTFEMPLHENMPFYEKYEVFEIPFKVWKIQGIKFEIPFKVWKSRGI